LLITSLKSTYSRPKLYFGFAASLILATGFYLTFIQPGTLYTDGSIFSAVALKDLNGGRLYIDTWENKPPGIIYLIELFMLIIRDDVYAVFILGFVTMCLLAMCILFLVYTYLRSLALSLMLVCITLYFTVYQNNIGDGLCTEIYGTFCLIASLACLEHFMSKRKRLLLIMCGLLLGAAPWFKEPFVLTCIALFIYFAIRLKSRKDIAALLAFCIIPSLVSMGLLAAEGSLNAFLDTFLYNFKYSSHQETNEPSIKLHDYYRNLILPVLGLSLLFIYLTFRNAGNRTSRVESIASFAVFISSTLFVFLAPYNLGHYYFPSFVLLFIALAQQYAIFIRSNPSLAPVLAILLFYYIYSIDKEYDPKFTFRIKAYVPDNITERLLNDREAILFVEYVNAGGYFIKTGKIHPAFLPVALPVHFDDTENGKKNRARIWKMLSETHPKYLITTYTTSYFSWHLPDGDFYKNNYEKLDSVFPKNDNVIYLWRHKQVPVQ
jgi:hypothetical protein